MPKIDVHSHILPPDRPNPPENHGGRRFPVEVRVGDAFPCTMGFIEHGFRMQPDPVAVDNTRKPRDYFARLFFDSCIHAAQALRHLLDVVGGGRVMLGTDSPFPLGSPQPGHSTDAPDLAVPQRAPVPGCRTRMAGAARTTFHGVHCMTGRTRCATVLLAVLAATLAPAAMAADYSLANGAVTFAAPDAWPMLMEKRDGARQFVALQVKNPGNPDALARITVTTEQVDGITGFQKFLGNGTERAHKLPGYEADTTQGNSSSMRYTAIENSQKNAYSETYAYRNNLAIQVRCVRPVAAAASWRATFDAGCKSIATAVEKAP